MAEEKKFEQWHIMLDGQEIGVLSDDDADDEWDAVCNWADRFLSAEYR